MKKFNQDSAMHNKYALIFEFAADKSIPSTTKKDMIKAALKIFDNKPLDALIDLLKARYIVALSGGDGTHYIQATEAIAMAIVSNAKSMKEISQVKECMGSWADSPQVFVLIVARGKGLI